MTCNVSKLYDRLVPPLVCNMPAGHGGPHGICVAAGLPAYVTWSR